MSRYVVAKLVLRIPLSGALPNDVDTWSYGKAGSPVYEKIAR